ncbi:hypothetical protein [Aliagarivorans taiwanensis]|uniref:hypothetical protein n=1 Tax=Aliagarivorans taiwanensis TaxID=561966 RepID=UPI000417B206|nr:hypothetical protein [Aliagarivorans taiwanensis]
MNKSLVTNLLAALLVLAGHFAHTPLVMTMGVFALSGAMTNWLAVHMLFEKVPGLYGSGVIPARFQEFKAGIKQLMMEQFFTPENIDRFLSDASGQAAHIDVRPVIEQTDFSPAFGALTAAVEQSSFGGMLAMVGGSQALAPLEQPFTEKLKLAIIEIGEGEQFNELLREQLESPDMLNDMQHKVAQIIDQRLAELSPQLVKEIIQTMIRRHLGWLVVWGGVFGALFGVLYSLI